tara:strand:+ start:260 stop:1168 length:909 start_codon:yes stop_codon:yes gene_type:complete
MKLAILGINKDAIFILERLALLNISNIKVSIYSESRDYKSIKKIYPSADLPWSLSDVLNEADLIFNATSISTLKSVISSINNIVPRDIPLIDFSANKSISIPIINSEFKFKSNVLHMMPMGKLNFKNINSETSIPLVSNSDLNTNILSYAEKVFKKLKIKFKFIDLIEHDSLVIANYYLPNLLLSTNSKILIDMNKSILNNINSSFILNIDGIIDNSVYSDLSNDKDFINQIDNSLNLICANIKNNISSNPKSVNATLKSTKTINSNNEIIPNSRDTIMGFFFGSKFTQYISGWNKIKDKND